MRHASSLVAAACLASLASPLHGEQIRFRDYPDANRGRQIGGALLLNREDKAWLLEPSLTELIAKCAAAMSDVRLTAVAASDFKPLDLSPPSALAAKCEDADASAMDGQSTERQAVVLVVAGDLRQFDPLESKPFDAEAEEAMVLAAGSRHTW